nr:SDR family NAD(P)-dependent oxidoreductase [Paracoccus sp. Arc7-R13]
MSKIALMTGADHGLGQNTALSTVRGGGDVIVANRSNAAQAEDVVAEIKAIGSEAVAIMRDVLKLARFSTFASNFQCSLSDVWSCDSFDHLVNRAGHGEFMPFARTTEAHFDTLLDMHVKGVDFLTQALRALIDDGGGT